MRTQVTFDCGDPHAQAKFWAQVFGTSVEDHSALVDQRVPEDKVVKNRVHLDIHVDADQKAAEVERLVGLGAQLIETHSDRGPLTYVMRDPEGNEFCLH